MGFLDRIKKALTPAPAPRLDDPQFGRLVFCGPDLWQSDIGHEQDVTFIPTNDRVTVTVSGDDTGPAPLARSAYNELESRYVELLPSIASFLRDDYRAANPSMTAASDATVMESFRVSGVSVKLSDGDVELEIVLTFQPEWCRELCIAVTIRHWQAVNAEGYD